MSVLAILARTYPATMVGVGLLSGLVNILYLTGSFFMLEVYDRVIPSRSLPTLVGLVALAGGLFVLQGLLEVVRTRIFVRLAEAFDETVSRPVFEAMNRSSARGSPDGTLALRDLEQVRGYLAGGGPSALFDLPWIPLYVGICYFLHPLIGLVAIAGCVTLAVLTVIADLAARSPSRALAHHAGVRVALAETGRRNAQTLSAMGMTDRHAARWVEANRAHAAAARRAMDRNGGFAAFSKVFRTGLQSGVLALGAWLVIEGNATGGVMIAASILVSRALAPAEQAIAHWKGLVAARDGWSRLRNLLLRMPATDEPLALPAPCQSLSVRSIAVIAPGMTGFTISDVSFELTAGQAMGVIGPSASGKSTLGRALLKVWPCARGTVRLDGAALNHWSEATLGPHVGYLAQEAELLAGTVGQNVARFQPDADPARIVAAAKAAGAHEMILDLPKGYDTPMGEDGNALSAGQRQRIGLARALYGDPFLVVLDEPNANLDAEGEAALTQAIAGIRARGGICIVIAHRPSVLNAVDSVLVMGNGAAIAFGPRDEVLKRVLKPVGVPAEDRPEPAFTQNIATGREVA